MKIVWQKAPVTCCLISVMVIIYLGMLVTGGFTTYNLLRWGALYPPLVVHSQWWRLFTAGFIHLGWEHILMNGLTLYLIGYYVEQLFGHWRLLGLFILSVLGGNLASFAFDPTAIAAGASTGIFGLFGAFIFLGSEFRNNNGVRLMARQFLILVVVNVVFDIFMPHVGLAAHLGGFLVGFLAAAALGAPRLGKISLLKRLLSGTILIVLGFLFYGLGRF
ncbi:rhomboid family intramembrane serine protease [Lactobacillus alvi]|uniref:Rhomboid family intramembrane serine protease n=1 Tax=Limosilactobacillus alvi TaxID=990412 RepID=A0ABS2EQI2_9LACO|nr:rhomboid family intramembrane serine protease [Limosilactobacillus alvi]